MLVTYGYSKIPNWQYDNSQFTLLIGDTVNTAKMVLDTPLVSVQEEIKLTNVLNQCIDPGTLDNLYHKPRAIFIIYVGKFRPAKKHFTRKK